MQEVLTYSLRAEYCRCIALKESESYFTSVNGLSLEFSASVTAPSCGTDLSLRVISSNYDVFFLAAYVQISVVRSGVLRLELFCDLVVLYG